MSESGGRRREITPLKNSNSDLHSRLKTRKVLGVGEIRDDKDVYRSKISQILGHSEQFQVNLPVGLYFWHMINVFYFAGYGLMALVFPATTATIDMSTAAENGGGSSVPYRLYGSLLLGYAILYKQLTLTKLKSNMTVGLKSAVLVFLLQTSVKLLGGAPIKNVWLQIVGLVGNILFHELSSQSKLLSIDWLKEWLECWDVGIGAGVIGYGPQQQQSSNDELGATPATEFPLATMAADDALSEKSSENNDIDKINENDKKLD
uniref:Tumor protein p53-inducible protein 11 n=1 Tax=Romanomermis culicivorax TaxID=13658 RepID=A0A915L2U8_ROMCU